MVEQSPPTRELTFFLSLFTGPESKRARTSVETRRTLGEGYGMVIDLVSQRALTEVGRVADPESGRSERGGRGEPFVRSGGLSDAEDEEKILIWSASSCTDRLALRVFARVPLMVLSTVLASVRSLALFSMPSRPLQVTQSRISRKGS